MTARPVSGKTPGASPATIPEAPRPSHEPDPDALTEAEVAQELADLAQQIAHHDAAYHSHDAPEISDADYDALRRRNSAIEARFPALIRPDSPSTRVGGALEGGFAKLRHRVPMLSLDNAFDATEFTEFCARAKRFLGRTEALGVRRRAKNRRSIDQPELPERPLRAWCHSR